jgi:hypothetical protein
MAEEKTYEGGCHCGAVRYRVTLALGPVISCNCSICSRTGALLAFAPPSKFELLRGADVLTDYQFGRKRIHQLFCSRCGVRSFSRGPLPSGDEVAAVNVRCLDGVDLDALPVRKYDGRALPLER